jgi:nucleotide-binding universal stress UspA family protein
MELKKILWPTDFSSNAEVALPYVQSLGRQYQTEVHVVYVISELGLHEPWYGDFDKSHIEKIHEWEEKTARKRLDDICENFMEGCPLFVKHIAMGDPAEEILKIIETENIDMVVMATHGRKGKFNMGSVADAVLKYSPKPVVTIPIGEKKRTTNNKSGP